jgi:hypothetical protein
MNNGPSTFFQDCIITIVHPQHFFYEKEITAVILKKIVQHDCMKVMTINQKVLLQRMPTDANTLWNTFGMPYGFWHSREQRTFPE